MNTPRKILLQPMAIVYLLLVSNVLMANEHSKWELGANFNIVGSDGTPTNDMLGFGFVGHYQLSNDWYTGFVLDYSPDFDFEHTAAVVGVVQDPAVKVIDAIGTSTAITAFINDATPANRVNFSGSGMLVAVLPMSTWGTPLDQFREVVLSILLPVQVRRLSSQVV